MKCMGVEGKGTLNLAQSVDGEVSARISKFLGVVRDGNDCDGDHGTGQ